MSIICSSLRVNDGLILSDLRFSAGTLSQSAHELTFLDLVDTSGIPFSLIAEQSSDVSTEDEATSAWFAQHLEEDLASYPGRQSGLGILVKLDSTTSLSEKRPSITEVVFFACPKDDGPTSDLDFILKALPLCSEIPTCLPSPPPSPGGVASSSSSSKEANLQFLPSLEDLRKQALAKEKKRKQVSGVFDEETERRRKARRRGGESVAAAAAQVDGVHILVGQKKAKQPTQPQTPDAVHVVTPSNGYGMSSAPPRAHLRTGSISATTKGDQAIRPLSRSPSISSEARPASRRGASETLNKRSNLSRVSSFAELASLEEKNKDAISRLVMAGMRLYGLQQRKKTSHVRRGSELQVLAGSSNNMAPSAEDLIKDEEYKVIYHQAYKGTVFAFRRVVTSEPLHANPACLQDTVDKLLAIFCTDPLAPT